MYTTQAIMGVVGFIGFRKYKSFDKSLRIIEWYIISSLIIDFIDDVLIYKRIHTLWLNQCFNVIELLLFSVIFYNWRTSKRNGFLIWCGFFFFLFIWIIGKYSFEPITGWDKYSGSVTQILQIGFGGWLLLGTLKETNIVWKEDIRFWVLSGIVLYAVATFLIFGLFTEMLMENRKLLLAIWPFNDLFIVIQYIFFLRAFLCNPVNAGITNTSQTTQKE
jgi:hypothetical protein